MKATWVRLLTLTLLLPTLNACTYSVHLVNFSDQRPYGRQGHPIHSESQQFVVMGFVGSTDYVNDAYKQLMHECSGGTVTAIATKYYTDHGFFSWTNHIAMDASCVN